MKMRYVVRRLSLVVFMLMTVILAVAQEPAPALGNGSIVPARDPLGQAESLLSSVYGRLGLYVTAGQAFKSDVLQTDFRAENELTFRIANIRTGLIEEIADHR